MPMTRIEPYRPPRRTIRELMEGRPAGEDDGGVPPKGCLGRPPRSAYRTEDRAEAQRRVRAREIQAWRRDDQRPAHEQENNTKRAGRRQSGEEGREERERIHVQQRGLKGWVAWHGRGPPRAAPQDGGGTGREHRTEPRQMAMQCCCACMRGGGNHAEKSAAKKKRGQHPAAPQGDGTEKDE